MDDELNRLLAKYQEKGADGEPRLPSPGSETFHGLSAELLEEVYPELKQIALRVVGSRRDVVTLQPTALVNEAFLRLREGNRIATNDRGHFFALAARIMRHLLVDSERRRRLRDGLSPSTIALASGSPKAAPHSAVDVLDLDAALVELAARSERQARVVEMRYFGGLEIEETAELLGVSHATVERDWTAARAWLGARLHRGERR